MIGWFFAWLFGAGAVGALWWWRHWRFRRNWQRLEEILAHLVAGTEPRSFAFEPERRFEKISDQLEKLADEQERLRRGRSRRKASLRAILSSMEDGVLLVDAQHTIRLTNPSLVRIFGLKLDPVGTTVLQALRAAELEQLTASVIASGESQRLELSLSHASPSRHLAVTATAVRESSGETAVAMVFHDVTRLKQLEDVRRQFVSNVSHELRTPLAIFQGYLENLIENPRLALKERMEVLQILQRHSGRLNLLVEDLLIIARLESRSDKLQPEPIAPAALLRGVLNDWKLRCKKKEIAISLEVAEDVPQFTADRRRIEQVLSNLVDNAIKYTEPGGRVVVSARCAGEHIEFSVVDDGIGIAPADLPHIFERFYRADKARSREQGGTGLGLSIVKHIAQRHGGSVGAESTHGEGTRITVRLPLQPFSSTSGAEPGGGAEQQVDTCEHQPQPSLTP